MRAPPQRQARASAEASAAKGNTATSSSGNSGHNGGAASSTPPVAAGAGGGRRRTNPSPSRSRGGPTAVAAAASPAERPSSAPPLPADVAAGAPPVLPPPPTTRVQAAVRVRPLVDFEKAAGPSCAEVMRVVTAAGRLTRPMASPYVLEVLPTAASARRGGATAPHTTGAAGGGGGGAGPGRAYAFDCCAGPATTQAEFFDLLEMPALCEAALAGEVVTVFCFGQTGSGKTHTLSGATLAAPEADPTAEPPPLVAEDGLQYRAVEYVARRLKGLRRSSRRAHDSKGKRRHDSADTGEAAGATATTITAKCSYVELYQESLYDLLQPDGGDNVRCRWSAAASSFYVEGSLMVECRRHDDFLLVLREGQRNRQRGSHALNHDSSRSHVVFTIFLESREGVVGMGHGGQDEGGGGDDGAAHAAAPVSTRYGRLVFVDLAGSERLKKTQSTSNAETGSINKSLFTLGRVLELLSAPSSDEAAAPAADGAAAAAPAPPFIPYRSSVLTQLLMHSLDGHGRTVMVACVSPSAMHVEESLRTIHYAERARHIRAVPVVHVDAATQQRMALEDRVRELHKENVLLRHALGLPRGGPLQEAEVLAHLAAMQQEWCAAALAAAVPAYTASPLSSAPPSLPPSRGAAAATPARPQPLVAPQARRAAQPASQPRRQLAGAAAAAAARQPRPQSQPRPLVSASPPPPPPPPSAAATLAAHLATAGAADFDAVAAQTVVMSSSSFSRASSAVAEGSGDAGGGGDETAPVPAQGGAVNIMALLDALPDTRSLQR